MAITITLANETFTLDETSTAQNGADGTPSGSPTPDSDFAIGTLPTAFSDYLFGAAAGQLDLDNTFSTGVGIAHSSTTFIHVVSDGGALATLGLTDGDGDPFTGTTVNDATSSGLFTTGGDEIYLVSALDNQVVLGMYDSDGDDSLDAVAFAVYMKTDGTLGTDEYVQLFSVTFTALAHPDAGDTADDYDDAIDLLSLVSITGTGSLSLNFDNMPSSANLFNDAAESAAGGGVIVFGRDCVVDGSGKYTNASDTIHTSQGGDGATIGVNNQMFDPGEGAYFTFVRDIDDRYLSGAKGGLSATEADYQQNMQYNSLIESTGASVRISQTQGNGSAGMTITAFELASAYQGGALIDHAGEGQVDIDAVYVWDSTHTTLLESYTNGAEDGLSNTIDIDITNGVASLTGLDDGNLVEWHTVSDHNQVLIEDTAGAWDLGGFGITEGAETNQSLAGTTFVEDSRPVFTADIDGGTIAYDSSATPITHTLNGDAGTDSPGTYAITSYEPAFDLLGAHITPIAASDGQSVIYFDDKNQDGDQDAGETLYYTMSLTPAGSYTFTVNNSPAAPPLVLDFDNLPSGSNLFGAVAGDPDGTGLFVFGENPVLSPSTTKYTNASDVIHTSQGGLGATIGVNNQMFDANEGAYFTFVDDIQDNFLAGVAGGLTATEADYGKNLKYDGGLHETSGAFLGISQIQAGSTASLSITAFLIDPNTAPQGVDLINASGDPSDAVDIFSVQVYQGSITGTLLESYSNGAEDGLSSAIDITIDGNGVAHVTGLDAGMVVAWSTDDPGTGSIEQHNQVLIGADAGKFDVGFFGFSEAQQIPDHDLNFQVTLTDADGDFVSSNSFQISVDA